MKKLFLLLCVVATSSSALAQVYALSKVTSVEESGLYVIEMDGHVLDNTITSNSLTSTTNYITTNLTGSESYVWELEKNGSSFGMKNVVLNQYLNNLSSTSLSFSTTKGSQWVFSFSNGLATIQTSSSGQLRSIGDVGNLAQNRVYYEYRAYGNSDLAKSKHEFAVYKLVTSIPASVSAAEYATFSSPFALDFSGEEELTVYTASVGQTKVSLHEVTSKRVPANTAVVLHGTSGSYTGVVIAEADALTGNDLHVATEAMSGADHNIYVLNKKNGVVGFYKLSATGTLAQGKAYLTQDSGAPMLSMSDDGEATAITDVPLPATTGSGVCYTLDGRRVAHPTKGVYILNGRKMVVR